MKIENGWIEKTIETLENRVLPPLAENESSGLFQKCHLLRKKPLKDFEIEDLRIMISQNVSLDYLIPLAIIWLEIDILAEGDFYEGDLLKSVLTSEKEYWEKEKGNWSQLKDLFERNENLLREFEISSKIRQSWFNSFQEFKSMK